MTRRPRLVLWDVDGTLVDSARLGRDAFYEAFETVTGKSPSAQVPFAGRTDLEIAHDMLEAAGVDATDDLLERFEERLVEALAARHDELARRGRALPGVRAVRWTEGDVLRLVVDEAATMTPTIVSELQNRGVNVAAVTPHEATFDEVFMRIVAKNV